MYYGRLVRIRFEKSLELLSEKINLYTKLSIEANIFLALNQHQYIVYLRYQLCVKFDFHWTSTEEDSIWCTVNESEVYRGVQ